MCNTHKVLGVQSGLATGVYSAPCPVLVLMTTTLAGVPQLPPLQEDDLTLRQVSTRSGGEVRILNKGIEVSSTRQ